MFCLNCNRIFEDNETANHKEYGEFWGAPYSEIISACPYCDSEDIIEYEPPKCDCCGKYCTSDYVEIRDGQYFCNDCYQIKDFEE